MLSGWEVLTGLHTQEQEAVLHMDATALIMDDGGKKKKKIRTLEQSRLRSPEKLR